MHFKYDKILARGDAEYAEKSALVTTKALYFIGIYFPLRDSVSPREKYLFLKSLAQCLI